MSAKITLRQIEDVTILDISGRITLGEGGVTLRDAIQDALKADHRKILLNMGAVNYMDSSGVGELTGAHISAKNKGAEVKLLNLAKKIDDLMQLTKLATIFDIFTDEPEALASFKS